MTDNISTRTGAEIDHTEQFMAALSRLPASGGVILFSWPHIEAHVAIQTDTPVAKLVGRLGDAGRAVIDRENDR